MQRYKAFVESQVHMDPHQAGDYVLYADHVARLRQAAELLRETLDVSYGASISLEVRGAIRAFLAASEPRQGEGNG